MPQATIDIQVVAGALQYALTGDGITLGPKRHRVAKNVDVVWSCPYDFGIQFSGTKSPFQSGAMSVSAPGGGSTSPQRTKNSNIRKKFKYFVAVDRGGSSPILTEDPDLEAGGDPGGGPGKKKSSSKRKKPAKKKSVPVPKV